MNRDALVLGAEDAISRGSKSFRAASRLFDRRTRQRAWLLYCWCRHCDDVCDGQELGRGGAAGPAGMAEAVARTEIVLAGGATGLLPFDALGAVLAECAIPHRYIRDHLAGFDLDEQGWVPRDEADLLRYCYHVAGAVGCMMAVVMGVAPDDEETLARACDLGIAFQLSNIARDIRDDAEAGRCYLPAQWLREAGLDDASVGDEENRAAVAHLVQRFIELVGRYERSARLGVPSLPFRSRWAVLSAAGLYGRIGRTVAELGPRAWDRRVVVPRREKARILATAFGEAIAA